MTDSTDPVAEVVVAGTCCVDVVVHPLPLERPIGADCLLPTEPLRLTTGGLAPNAGVALARLGARVAVVSQIGDDDWGQVLKRRLCVEGVQTWGLTVSPEHPTSTTAVLVDEQRRHSFAHCPGAAEQIDRPFLEPHLPRIAESRFLLLGYYAMLPRLEHALPEILPAIRAAGCQVVLDSAGGGGRLSPLDAILPQVDIYFPSLQEAAHQTGESEPSRILETFRAAGAVGVLGIKLGADGAVLSPRPGQLLRIPAIPPPGAIADTVGAGDCFLAGLIVGLLRGYELQDAARIGAAAGSACVTGVGAASGLRDWRATLQLAGVDSSASES